MWALLLFDRLPEHSDWGSTTASGEVAGGPGRPFPQFFLDMRFFLPDESAQEFPQAVHQGGKTAPPGASEILPKCETQPDFRKQKRRVAILRVKISDMRTDFLHKSSTVIGKSHVVVPVEGLSILNMIRVPSYIWD